MVACVAAVRQYSARAMTGQPAQKPRVSVIVPARNAQATLGRTLEALGRQRFDRAYEVVVVDNGSTDGTAKVARTAGSPVVLVRNAPGHGPGHARNVGVAHARGTVLAFTDADCFPEPDWLAHGCAALADADLVQGAVAPDPAAPRAPFDRTLQVSAERGFYETANIFVRRELFEQLGGFRDWVVERGGDRPFGEDALFGWTARRHGARTRFSADARVHHAVFPGTAIDWIRYRWLWRLMPALAQRIPELREAVFYRRWFYGRRTARFDAAVAAVALTVATRRPLVLMLAVPYAEWVRRESVAWGFPRAIPAAAAAVAADAVTCVALIVGSIRSREPLF